MSGWNWRRFAMRASQGVIAVECAWVIWTLLGFDPRFPVGSDYRAVVEAASRWLAGGSFYAPQQLAGPYPPILPAPYLPNIMYPPVTLWLFVPFTILPAVLWWALPVAGVAWSFYRLRPAWWAWPIIAALWLYPRAPEAVQNGNPVMWALLAVSLGCVYTGPAALALFKPTLGLFALFGVRRRRWWLALGMLGLLCLPFGAMWLDYARVVANLRSPLWFLWHDWPLMTVPLVAWLARSSPSFAAPYRQQVSAAPSAPSG
jgi:hypothetical protein